MTKSSEAWPRTTWVKCGLLHQLTSVNRDLKQAAKQGLHDSIETLKGSLRRKTEVSSMLPVTNNENQFKKKVYNNWLQSVERESLK